MCFITFEGPEGSGKTTQIALLQEWLTRQGYHTICTREPGGTEIGDQIRKIIVEMSSHNLFPEAELLLFNASRAQLVRERIRPALEAGKIVLCDRFADATIAYQGYGHGLSLTTLADITRFATDGLVPDMTLLLDIAPADGLHRRRTAADQGAEWNRLDDLDLAFHQRVRMGYHALAAADSKRWRIVDADRPVEVVQAEIRFHLGDLLSKWKTHVVE